MKETQINYAVSKEWIEAWKNFLYVNNRFLRKNFLNGYPSPGPVNNSSLYDENGKINLMLEKVIKILACLYRLLEYSLSSSKRLYMENLR